MKPIFAAPYALFACGAALAAEPALELYGAADLALRTSDDGQRWRLQGGAYSGSHWGIRSAEITTASTHGVFKLESGFDPADGTLGQNGRIFGRQAWVGAAGKWGQLTIGRHYGALIDVLTGFDPLGIGAADSATWNTKLIGNRFNRSVKYELRSGALKFGALYSFGRATPAAETNRGWSARLTHEAGPLLLGAGYETVGDDSGKRAHNWIAGGAYTIRNTKLFGGYIDGRIDPDFGIHYWRADHDYQDTYGDIGIHIDIDGFGRHDRLAQFGTRIQWTPRWSVTMTYLRKRVSNVPTGYQRQTFYAVADYALSKHTDLYLFAEHNRNSDAVPLQPARPDGLGDPAVRQTGVMAGFWYRF